MNPMPWMDTGTPAMTRNSSELHVGARLAALRAQRGVSQGMVARRAEIAPSYLSRIETGRVQPSLPMLLRILDALHADLTDLRSPGGDKRPPTASCPVSGKGVCLLELVRREADVARAEGREVYSIREVNLLHDLAAWMRKASPERVRAIELLIGELLEKTD
jgi:transcriptional regulator with XRE-family HTH domain